jgi:ABC-type sugar transport system ATPase subunit
MPAIQLRNISKQYQRTPVLTDVSLAIGVGQRWALLGRSGVGKTTLLRIISGLELPDAGLVLIDGKDVTGHPPHQRQAALLNQDYPLYPQLTVAQNLRAALQGCHLTSAEVQARIDEALHWFRIHELRERLPNQLSGGQAQRVALARALVRRPALLLLDEPLSQVDGIWRTEIRELILAAVQQYATSLIMVTHDPQDALLMASHLAVLNDSKIIQQGDATEIYQNPSSTIAAELLSPFGINWFDLTSDTTAQLCLPTRRPTGKKLLGIRVDQLRSIVEGRTVDDYVRINARILQVRSCGFARIGEGMLGDINGVKFKVLDWNNTLHPGMLTLYSPVAQCVWL